MRARFLEGAAVLAVLTAYVFFGSEGTWRFPLGPWGQSYHASLAEGFLSGRVSLAAEPDRALVALPNPYDPEARAGIPVLWDASYFEGRYYLYFSAVPALSFYVPVRLITGAYPNDALGSTFFASVGFLFLAAIARRTRPRQVPAWLWVIVAGVGNVVPFVITQVLFYMVVSACAWALTAAWAYAVLRFREEPSPRWAVAMGAFLALAIATRPNLIVLLAIQAYLVFRHRRSWIAVVAPLVLVACALLAYNYARFRDGFEFGVSYQMASAPMQGRAICGVCGPGEIPRLINHATHYVFWPPVFLDRWPYAFVQHHRLDPAVTYKGGAEPVAGIAAFTPLALVATLLAIFLPWRRTGPILLFGGWLVLFTLSSCWWVTARYTLDFLGLFVAGTILTIEDGLALLTERGIPVRRLRAFCILLAVYSIVLGALLPFQRM
jgi:hypothetical protein